MSKKAATTAHQQLIARFNAITTVDELDDFLANDVQQCKVGFPLDLPDGHYFDGAFFATFRSGEHVMTRIQGWPAEFDHIWPLWDQLNTRKRAERDAQRDAERDATDEERAERRGRPVIGRPVQIRLPEWLIRQIDLYADANDLTRAEAARKWLVAGHAAIKAGAAQ